MSVIQVSQFQWSPEHVIGAKAEDVIGWNKDVRASWDESRMVPEHWIGEHGTPDSGFMWFNVDDDGIVGQIRSSNMDSSG